MENSRIYHGGSLGRSGGFFPASTPTPTIDTIRIPIEEKSFHYANSNPITSALHTTPNDSNYGYKTDDFTQFTRGFISFPKPHKDWTRVITGATGITLAIHGYHETVIAAPNNIVRFNFSITITRVGETVNYVAPAGSPPIYTRDVNCATTPAFQLATMSISDLVIHNPSGLNPDEECMFHLRALRNNNGGGDTYPNVFRVMGGYVEFPLS